MTCLSMCVCVQNCSFSKGCGIPLNKKQVSIYTAVFLKVLYTADTFDTAIPLKQGGIFSENAV